jgi:1-pyrroline-5-carboxylate dehydrogenase
LLIRRRNAKQVATAISRGAFEFQGQKCSAASRVYIPQSMWEEVKEICNRRCESFKMGSPEDMKNFITAVIHEGSFDKLAGFI